MEDSARELIHTGLVFSEMEEVHVDVEKVEPDDIEDPKERYETDVSGGQFNIVPTSAGDVVFKVFGGDKKKELDKRREERMKRVVDYNKKT
jgi:hypothetical protein